MTKLREQMIQDMTLRGLSPNTQRAYLQAVTRLARHYDRSPDRVSKREVKAYRHYGLLANRSRQKKIARCRELLSASEPKQPAKQTVSEKLLRLTGVDLQRCPECHEGRMIVTAEIERPRRCSLRPLRVEILDSS
jgi:hypothetical protein